jgi:hypothetical protein
MNNKKHNNMNTFTDNELRAKGKAEKETKIDAKTEVVTTKLRKDFNDLSKKWI